eukprot:GHVU01159305.1.p1 GENE.GHVU01159305.1~~GHVU01159305.1.p1  ORF type:complete len:107 (+),score=6.44 GHVU01159305.1:341-661(+)
MSHPAAPIVNSHGCGGGNTSIVPPTPNDAIFVSSTGQLQLTASLTIVIIDLIDWYRPMVIVISFHGPYGRIYIHPPYIYSIPPSLPPPLPPSLPPYLSADPHNGGL